MASNLTCSHSTLLSSTIPSELGHLSKLRTLDVGDTRMGGPFPETYPYAPLHTSLGHVACPPYPPLVTWHALQTTP